jgi:hypothetical protein
VNQAIPCPYCGNIGYHMWAGGGGCPGAVSERERDAVAVVYLRAYAETIKLKDAEIERLKAKKGGPVSLISDERVEELLLSEKEKDAEIQRLTEEIDSIALERDEWKSAYSERFENWKALLRRAADALEGWSQNDAVARSLIAELREAAE